jgi:hypothetical protein
MWSAGIDWADQHHDVVVIDEQGKQLAKQRVPHSVEGMTALLMFLRGIGDVQEHPDHLACIIEINKGVLITVLLDAGLPVYPVNPKTLEKWRKPSGAKHWRARDAVISTNCAAWNRTVRWCRNSSS